MCTHFSGALHSRDIFLFVCRGELGKQTLTRLLCSRKPGRRAGLRTQRGVCRAPGLRSPSGSSRPPPLCPCTLTSATPACRDKHRPVRTCLCSCCCSLCDLPSAASGCQRPCAWGWVSSGRAESRTLWESPVSSVRVCQILLGNPSQAPSTHHDFYSLQSTPVGHRDQRRTFWKLACQKLSRWQDKVATEFEITATTIQSLALGIFNWVSFNKSFNSEVFCFLNSELEMKMPPRPPQSLWGTWTSFKAAHTTVHHKANS